LGPGSVAGIFSPSVVIFKDDLDNDCKDLAKEKFAIVSVITVTAPRGPDLSADRLSFKHASDLEDLGEGEGAGEFDWCIEWRLGMERLALFSVG